MDWQASLADGAGERRVGGRLAGNRPSRGASAAGCGGKSRRDSACPAGAMLALRAWSACEGRASADHWRRTAPSGHGDTSHPSSGHRISVPSRGLSRVWREHARRGAGGSNGALRPTVDGSDRVSDSGVPPTTSGGGSSYGSSCTSGPQRLSRSRPMESSANHRTKAYRWYSGKSPKLYEISYHSILSMRYRDLTR